MCVWSCGGSVVTVGFILLVLELMLPALVHLSSTCSQSQPPLRQLYTARVLSVYACMLLSMCICLPIGFHRWRLEAHPILDTLNTRLLKLPCGVAWPPCHHRSLYSCHNKNQVLSHLYYCSTALSSKNFSPTLALLCTAMSPGFHELIDEALSGSIALQPSQGRRAFSPQVYITEVIQTAVPPWTLRRRLWWLQ